ncbi:MAG: hypothetical protein KJP12_03490 [Acidimicrobiia bacterium]|nr:hypothetical protein [Acidimicrobiia bacterium]MBT8214263.1 hypothetical protein [Acidimicrobiia bacterium]NNF69275.1 hypothetical protein [Acidimicrobiia bacterium]NNK91095.1 hypothetical protein [Acidimicrobiia bacterium]
MSTSGRFSGALRTGGKHVADRVALLFSAKGAGFQRLAESHAASVAGDTLVALALASTLFFSVPSTTARDRVALYLLLTLAPFAILGPLLGRIFERFRGAYRGGLMVSSLARVVFAIVMMFGIDSLWLYPVAFGLLVFSRIHGISKASMLPVVLDSPQELITANTQLAKIGVLASAVVIPPGVLAVRFVSPILALVLAVVAFIVASLAASLLPTFDVHPQEGGGRAARRAVPRSVRLARLATAGVRLLNGYLLLLVAFAFRDVDAGVLDFGALLAAAGLGFFIAAFVTPLIERRVPEEPMVVAALAVAAAAAFIASQGLSLLVAGVLAAAAGFAWGTAKFGFDGLLQMTVAPAARGRAFTTSETLFQLAWVVGAIIPVTITIDDTLGLNAAGVVALVIQVVYVTALLVPIAVARRAAAERDRSDSETADLSDLI